MAVRAGCKAFCIYKDYLFGNKTYHFWWYDLLYQANATLVSFERSHFHEVLVKIACSRAMSLK